MTKEEKIAIIDTIISRAESLNYDRSSEMLQCKDEAKSFVRNVIDNGSDWLERIDRIRWSLSIVTSATPSSDFAQAWGIGKKEFVGVLHSIRSEVELYSSNSAAHLVTNFTPRTRQVFIVHGHNDIMKVATARTLEKLGLIPMILHEQPNKGRTIIEKFERLSTDVSFAVVLLSADDQQDSGKFRARQNVILELGFFLARLGRDRVMALYDTSSVEIELPSDITGVLYEPYDKPEGVWRFELVQELRAAGFDVDASALT